MNKTTFTPYLQHYPTDSDGDLAIISKRFVTDSFGDITTDITNINTTLVTIQNEIDDINSTISGIEAGFNDVVKANTDNFIPFKVKKILYTNRISLSDFSDLSLTTNDYIVLSNQTTVADNGLYKQTGANTAIKITTIPVIGGTIVSMFFFEASAKNFVYLLDDGTYYTPSSTPRKIIVDFNFTITSNSNLSILNIPFYSDEVTHCNLTASGQATITSVLYSQTFITKMTIRNSSPSNEPHVIEHGNLSLVNCSYGNDLTFRVQSSSAIQAIEWRIFGEVYFGH